MSHERRIFVDGVGSEQVGVELQLSSEDSHYLKNVLRCHVGDPIIIVDRLQSVEYEAFITSTDIPRVTIKISAARSRKEYCSRVAVVLCALCKQSANEFIVEKATELGVSQIWFFQAERSISRVPTDKEREKKTERLNKVAESALRQSGRMSSPLIKVIGSLAESLGLIEEQRSNSIKFVAALLSDSQSIAAMKDARKDGQDAVVAVGPEGDFSPFEYEMLLKNSFLPITLGGNRLRAETAVIAAIAGLDAIFE